jgi:death-on-curing protein
VIAYISAEQVIGLHRRLIEEFGGADGLRDRGLLESAVARPAASFGGEDLYPDFAAKAGALMHSLAMNHPFVDGNKRTAIASAQLMCLANGYRVLASQAELEDLTMATARGEFQAEALAIWFRQRLASIESD